MIYQVVVYGGDWEDSFQDTVYIGTDLQMATETAKVVIGKDKWGKKSYEYVIDYSSVVEWRDGFVDKVLMNFY